MTLFVVIFGLISFKFGVSLGPALVWTAALAAFALVLIVLIYRSVVLNAGVPDSMIWRLPQAADVTLDTSRDEALQRLRAAVRATIPAAEVGETDDGGFLITTARTTWRGGASISVSAETTAPNVTHLRLTAKPAKIVDDGYRRAMVYVLARALDVRQAWPSDDPARRA